MSDVNQVSNPVPTWLTRILRSIKERKFSGKLEINIQHGDCISDHTKLQMNAEQVIENLKPVKTY